MHYVKKETKKIASLEGDMIRISFPYNAAMVANVRTLHGRKWVPERKEWTAPASLNNYQRLKEWEFQIDTSLEEWYKTELNPKKTAKIETGLPLYPYQEEGVNFIESRNGRALIGDEMGCISGDAFITINRGKGAGKISLEALYLKSNGLPVRCQICGFESNSITNTHLKTHGITGEEYNKKFPGLPLTSRWDTSIPIYTRSLSLDKTEFRLNRIKKIIFNGIRPVFKVQTESHEVRATSDHIFFTEEGEKPLDHLKVGDFIYTNGQEQCLICGSGENLITYKYSKFLGYCKSCMYRSLRKNGRWKGGESIRRDGYIYITSGTEKHPYNRTDGMLKHRLIMEAYLNGISFDTYLKIIKIGIFTRDHIFLTPKEAVHHKDGDILNNHIDNLEVMGHDKHMALHGNYQNFGKFFLPKLEQIKSIVSEGSIKVYDIKMEGPNHNFIANGVVVHNCGKTVQALAWLKIHPELRPTLIVCPASLKLNWAKEIKQWLGEKQKYEILSGTQPSPITEDLIIINYDILDAWKHALKDYGLKVVIADECHYVKSSKARRTKALQQVCRKVPHVIGLSGTPVINRPVEFYNPINIINSSVFPNWFAYTNRYCDPKTNYFYGRTVKDYSGASNTQELHGILTSTIMIRRLKKDVLKELPEKTRTLVPLEIDPSIYDEIMEELYAWLDSKGDNPAGAMVEIEKTKQAVVEAKMDGVITWIKDFLECDGKLVVFCTHQKTIDQLEEKFKSLCVVVDGRIKQGDRQKNVERFQNDNSIRLFLGNIKAAGVGLTLTAASNVAFVELPWSPGDAVQAEDRCHRIGQADAVTAYYLIARGTIEEDITKLLEEKAKVLASILDGKSIEDASILSELLKKLGSPKT